MKAKANHLRKIFRTELASVFTLAEIDFLFFLFLEHYTGISKTDFFFNPGREIVFENFENIIERLKNNEPWQYITGQTEFAGLKIKVDRSVLIPRPETEELVLLIIENQKDKKVNRILDIGTGSGAIALGLKKSFPAAEVIAMDHRRNILERAAENAKINRLEIETFQGDVLKNIFPQGDFDMIVSNPPYVLPSEKDLMGKNVLEYEPHEALFVPENDPIVFYKRIIDFFIGGNHGILYFELNPETSGDVEKYALQRNCSIRFFNDASGKRRFAEICKI
jgi:release factor glutamine methyltransferase